MLWHEVGRGGSEAEQRDCGEGSHQLAPGFSGPQFPLSSVKLRFLHARPGWGDFYMEAGRGCLSSRSEPLVHWERQKNKRTRIQIRKAQSRGCRGNLRQAPSFSGVGAATCQARLPLPPRPPPPAQRRSPQTQERGKGTEKHLCPVRWARQAWAPTTSFIEITPLPELGLHPKASRVHEATAVPPPRPQCRKLQPRPSAAWADTASLRVEMPSGFCQCQWPQN